MSLIMDSIKRGLTTAGILGGIALILAVITGWWAVIQVDGADAVAGQSTTIYLLLALILPISLAILSYLDRSQINYATWQASLIQLFSAGFAGSIFASGLFIYGNFQIAVVFGGEDPTQMINALRIAIFKNAIFVIGITSLAALAIGLWANRRVSSA